MELFEVRPVRGAPQLEVPDSLPTRPDTLVRLDPASLGGLPVGVVTWVRGGYVFIRDDAPRSLLHGCGFWRADVGGAGGLLVGGPSGIAERELTVGELIELGITGLQVIEGHPGRLFVLDRSDGFFHRWWARLPSGPPVGIGLVPIGPRGGGFAIPVTVVDHAPAQPHGGWAPRVASLNDDQELADELASSLIDYFDDPDRLAGLPWQVAAWIATRYVEDEVLNGGMCQAVVNWSVLFMPAAIEGYRRIGLANHAAVLEEALALADSEVERLGLVSTHDLWGSEIFDRFDDHFDDVAGAAARAALVRQHPDLFEQAAGWR